MGFLQPRSQGSLLPALRSSVGRVGENLGNEVGIPVEQNNPAYLKEFLVKICSFSRLITKYDKVFLQFKTASRLITIYDNVLLQFVIAWLLQFSKTVITIYDDSYYNLRQVLQFIDHDIITIHDSTEQLLCISFTWKR